MEPSYVNLMYELLYDNEGQHRVSMAREVVLVKYETRIQRRPSYSLTMCLHGMCPSSTIGKQKNLIGVGQNSELHIFISGCISVSSYSHHVGFLLALEMFMLFMWLSGMLIRHCTIGFEGVMWSSQVLSKTISRMPFMRCMSLNELMN